MLISKFDITNIEERICSFESRYNIELPVVYRKFMHQYNGGETPKTSFKANRKTYEIRAFFGIDLGDAAFSMDRVFYLDSFINRSLLPIAVDYFDNYYAINIGDNGNGVIFFLNHEKGYKEQKLFDTFKELIAASKSAEIGHIRTIEERKQALISNGYGHLLTPEKIAGWQAEINRYKNIHQENVDCINSD